MQPLAHSTMATTGCCLASSSWVSLASSGRIWIDPPYPLVRVGQAVSFQWFKRCPYSWLMDCVRFAPWMTHAHLYTPARVRLYSVALHRASSSTTFKSLSDHFFCQQGVKIYRAENYGRIPFQKKKRELWAHSKLTKLAMEPKPRLLV